MNDSEYIYVLGDGNKIREKVEYYLLNHDLEALTAFSQNLTVAVNQLKETATSTMDARTIVAGGDDIIFCTPREKYRKELIQQLQKIFYDITSVTISFGIGKTIEAAYINLRRAKSSRNIEIVEEENL